MLLSDSGVFHANKTSAIQMALHYNMLIHVFSTQHRWFPMGFPPPLPCTKEVIWNYQIKFLMHCVSVSFPACPPGSYKMSSKQQECFPCPANSVAEEEGSVACVCEEDHFRTPLDTPSAPCTRNETPCVCVCVCVRSNLSPPSGRVPSCHSCVASFHAGVPALSEQFHVCEPIIMSAIHSASNTPAVRGCRYLPCNP